MREVARPLVSRAFRTGEVAEGDSPLLGSSERAHVQCIPVRHGGAVVANARQQLNAESLDEIQVPLSNTQGLISATVLVRTTAAPATSPARATPTPRSRRSARAASVTCSSTPS